ncbi:MAG: trypsin-like peptidase domain-containing protein [Actinomycetota bacterium]|nr:trypsin-like peptidase domain-containing protein [Actinomycetota bacterium]
MTQQTHPHETDGPREEHAPTTSTPPEQGESREPLWYDGPAAWRSPSARSGGGPDDRTDVQTGDQTRGSERDFGLSSTSTTAMPSSVSAERTQEHPGSSESAPTAPVPTSAGGFGWHDDGAKPSFDTSASAAAGGGSGSGSFGAGTPGWGGGGDSGWGGPYSPAPSIAPAPQPKTRQGRRWAEIGVVALVAAALAGGGSYYAATQGVGTTTPSTSAGSAPASSSNPPAPVAQGNPSSPDWTVTAKAVSPSVVAITVQSSSAEGQGSGVIIDATNGYILTNNHVATGAGTGAKISVTLSDGRSYDATIKGTDPSTDLAVLQIKNPPSGLKAISIGDSSSLTVGQPVMAVGNPLGLAGTVTTGIVSALNRPVTTASSESGTGSQSPFGGQPQSTGTPVVTNAIQTSAAINPGNSGGALVTADGQLIGINSSIASLGGSSGSSQSGNIGIGFAIPSKEARSIADQLIATGTAQHAYLGVSASDTTVTDGNSKRAAALIRTLSSGTPAAGAGLKQGDAVVAINGQSIESSESLVATIHEYGVGDKVTVSVIRGGSKQDITLTLAARPAQG